jgi:hypothetical protein
MSQIILAVVAIAALSALSTAAAAHGANKQRVLVKKQQQLRTRQRLFND